MGDFISIDEFKVGDLVKRTMASHYTDHNESDAIGVIISLDAHLAKVYFYDTSKNEVWNRKVLEAVKKGVRKEEPMGVE
tara:strand:- start:430 stop:666 length:237 start_codon:yes stop_codon:yes gene_type:complete